MKKIIIDGDPISQGRPRFKIIHGKSWAFDPNSKDKANLQKLLKSHYNGPLLKHPSLSMIFYMPIPESTPKAFKQVYDSGLIKHEKKPDIDNMIKFYLDCLDGIMFDGDQKVQLGTCIKLYHPQPKTIIYYKEGSEYLEPQDLETEIYCDLLSVEFYIPKHLETVVPRDSTDADQLEQMQSSGKKNPPIPSESSISMPASHSYEEEEPPQQKQLDRF